MIRVYRWDGDRVERDESVDTVGLRPPPDGWIWVDLLEEPDETIRSFGESLALEAVLVEEALAPAHLPMLEEHPDHLFVVLHGFTTGSGERLTTPETDIFLTDRVLLTIRDGPRQSIDEFAERLEEGTAPPVDSPAVLLAQMALGAGRRFGSLISELERQVDVLEELALQGAPQTAVEVQALRRDVIYLRRALAPQFEVYEDLSESAHPAIDEAARSAFRRVAGQHERALDSLESGRALLASVLEIYRGAIADQTNEIMRVLTVFSAILLPLSLIAGLWGMNFPDIPGTGQESGFWVILGLMVALALGVWIYFARRGFIGAPRVRDIPKSVGLGLFNIGTAPIRVVAEGIKQLGRTESDQG